MGPNVRLVTSTDIPILGRLFAEVFNEDLLRLFILSHGLDLDLNIKSSQIHYQKDYGDYIKLFLKAIDVTTGEIVGFMTWTRVEKQGEEPAGVSTTNEWGILPGCIWQFVENEGSNHEREEVHS